MSAVFASVLVRPTFMWGFNKLGYVFLGQIATAVAVPFICGWGSDVTTKWLSKRNKGASEVRLSPFEITRCILTAHSQNGDC
jgi:hypothetical protein